ncbi:tetratricopeptide repeat protein [Microbulbifer sp. OS29]|uniref:Tetratricopeptide repeat protein n=1 Tax=Microbulbifer okhotskensis TaxID=2926617 RepID=A0A9X2ELF3_9GAMM|nr:tetratricopeptide repeat protein [Microbulbifer okhotskensis]MCO1334417.1 tetratricopeptide repeat protein [Microbulbifer okhotskensis]
MSLKPRLALKAKVFIDRFVGAAFVALLVSGCAINSGKTIGSLQSVDVDIQEEHIDGSLEKALVSYQRYLQETPESKLTPEAMRRIADLKIKQAHRAEDAVFDNLAGAVAESGAVIAVDAPEVSTESTLDTPAASASIVKPKAVPQKRFAATEAEVESDAEFEVRASGSIAVATDETPLQTPGVDSDAMMSANAREAIDLYLNLLKKYPLYHRNDQVMYQLSRAYEEAGQIDTAVDVLRQLVAKYPDSRHIDESWFRLGEYSFTRKKFLDAEDAYGKVIDIGVISSFYELALYKRGWTLFKQDMYEMALDDYIEMLDYKVSQGYDFDQQSNRGERKHIDDTFRVVSLSFSYLEGPDSVVDYFTRKGSRDYEFRVYRQLGEYYLEKRRYQDAATSYIAFVDRNPLHKVSADFSIRVIEIYDKGGFPKLVLEAKKAFANTYALNAEYWTAFDINEYGEVVAFLQTNLIDLAGHYHSAYQNKKLKDKKVENYREAIHWYRSYLQSFAETERAPEINYQLAGLMLENRDFHGAALEYERTAYNYPVHKDSSEAGYAAVYAYREHLSNNLKGVSAEQRAPLLREIIRSSLTFAATFPEHGKAPQIMLGAVEDLYGLKDYAPAIVNGRSLLEQFPTAEQDIRRSTWMLVAHASFDTKVYVDAEIAYGETLNLTAEDAEDRVALVDNLAASIYQQGDRARQQDDHVAAAGHFLRIRNVAPGATLLATAEYDAAASLIILKDWTQAAMVLNNFRNYFPEHQLAKDVTKKLAVVYQESGELLLAAAEFERIERESEDDEIRREALTQAADLYAAAKDSDKALTVLRRYVDLFPDPLEPALETRQKIANIYKDSGDQKRYMQALRELVRIESRGGAQRSDRTRFLAGSAALLLAEPSFEAFARVELVKPIEQSLNLKRKRMKTAIAAFTNLIDYQVADVTAAATYYLAEIYLHFSVALKNSERPDNLSALELEEYELALEEQIYPFEEKAISVYQKNVGLLGVGIYNPWIDKSIGKLAGLMPARYARTEEAGDYLQNIIPLPPVPELPAVGEAVSGQ